MSVRSVHKARSRCQRTELLSPPLASPGRSASLSALGDAGINRAGPFILAGGFKAELLPSCEKRPQAVGAHGTGTGTGARCSLKSRSEGCPHSGPVSSRWAGARGVVPQMTWKWETSERSETAPCPCLPARSCPLYYCLPPLLSPAPPGPVKNRTPCCPLARASAVLSPVPQAARLPTREI